ncbi:MAG: hypothetical protein JJU11_01980, partial [Candidatus Sumerlaeia bacterium]|nr:hypothetical protein [Candidatus Sumerlaeia bacterium]
LMNELPTHVKAATHLGIIVDANGSPSDRWNAVKDRLYKSGIEIPSEPTHQGVIANGMEPGWKVGIWMMPDNSNSGALEDFLLQLIPQKQEALKHHAGSSTEKALNLGGTFENLKKATLYTWLAWQEVPGLPYGTAIKSRYFETTSSLSSSFRSWFQDLFLPDEDHSRQFTPQN